MGSFKLQLILVLLTSSVFVYGQQREDADSIAIKKVDIGEVVVSATSSSRVALSNGRLMESVPSVLGEVDVVKYITSLPGVSSTSILDPNFYVRGGSGSENRYYVSGFPIASPKHLSGIMALFDPYVLSSSTLYKSGYGAQYSGALSSFLNMYPTMQRDSVWHGELSLGLISSSLRAAIPVGKSDGVLSLSLRASYLESMLNMVNSIYGNIDVVPYSFGDVTGSYACSLGDSWSLKSFGLYSYDYLEINNLLFDWESYSLNATAQHQADRSSLTIAAGVWGRESGGSFENFFTDPILLSEDSGRVQASLDYFLGDGITLLGGVSAESTLYHYGSSAQSLRANLFNGYISAQYSPQWGGVFDAGVNLEQYCSTVNSLKLLPRARYLYDLSPVSSIWADYARTAQYTSYLTMLSLPSPADVNIPLRDGEQATLCDQVSIGAETQLRPWISLYGAIFHRRYLNAKEFTGVSITQSISDLDSVVSASGHGAASGFEAEVKMEWRKLSSRINYTYTDSWREFSEINGGERFSPPYDITHNIMATLLWQPCDRVTLSAMWQYGSGTYVTFPVGVAVANNVMTGEAMILPIYDDMYNYQLPATHRLDLSAEYSINDWSFNIGVYNAYNQSNISYIDYQIVAYDTYTSSIEPCGITVLPIIPYLSLTRRW